MTEPFDPYRDWLELDSDLLASGEPLSFYQLISVEPFENDDRVIARAIDRAQAKVRSQRPGTHAAKWAKLLDDLKEVRATLTDPNRKQAYDDSLRGNRTTQQGTANANNASQQPALESVPEEIVAGEATSSLESTNRASGHSWPPGMEPPEADTPATEKHVQPSPSPSVPASVQPTVEPVQPQPTAGGSDPNDAIPLSARWPIPQSPVDIPASVATQQSATPSFTVPAGNAPTAQPTNAVPMAVPLAAIHGSMPQSPVPTPGMHSAPAAAPMAMPLGSPSSPLGQTNLGPTPQSDIPMGSAAPQAHYSESASNYARSLPDPMAPMEVAPQSSIPVGKAIAHGSASDDGANGASESLSEASQAAIDSDDNLPRSASDSPRRKSKSSNATIYLSLAVVVVMVIGAAVIFGGLGGGYDDQGDVAQIIPPPSSDPSNDDLRPLNPNRTPATPPAIEVEEPVDPRTPEEPATPDSGNNDPEPPVTPPPAEPEPPAPEPTPPEPEPMPEPPRTVVMRPEPMPAPPPPTVVTVTDAEISELSKLFTTARQALSDQNVDEAKQAVEKAVAMAKAPAHVAKAERLRMLTMLVSEFWRAVDGAIEGLEGGEVISIANTQVAVVEVTPDLLIIRVNGTNRRYPRASMSEGLAMGLADNWLDKTSEVTPLVRGAFFVVAKNNDFERAREQWQLAASKGADVGDLNEVITDKYDEATLKQEAGKAMNMVAKPVVSDTGNDLSDADKQALATALRTARTALTTGQIDDADAQLVIAANIAADSNLRPVVKRTETLARHARVFWNAVAEGMERLSPNSKLTIGNTEITITEVSRDQIAYTVAGLDRSHTRYELPGGLAMVIANTVLAEDTPESALARGAYYAIAEKGSADDARAAWNEAADSPDVAELMLTLDDSYQW